ncbi:MAG TPA: DUF4402 domain-containing protein [Holophagaceae bacterium]|jgi:hypothetical protein|nr:DUF4402 domain-containing protein [Holophagaceae bacterium]
MNRALVATALTLASTAAFAAAGNTANTTANATATILKPIAISKTTDMQFGNVLWGGAAAGTLAMTAAPSSGALTLTPDGANVTASYGTQTAATFQVGGTKNKTFTVALAPATLTLAAADATTLTVTGLKFVESTTATAAQATGGQGTLNATSGTVNGVSVSGQDTLYVFGTLNVPVTATESAYSTGTGAGTPMTVTVTYN